MIIRIGLLKTSIEEKNK